MPRNPHVDREMVRATVEEFIPLDNVDKAKMLAMLVFNVTQYESAVKAKVAPEVLEPHKIPYHTTRLFLRTITFYKLWTPPLKEQ